LITSYFVGTQNRVIDTRSSSFLLVCCRALDLSRLTNEYPYIGISRETFYGGELLYKCYAPQHNALAMDQICLYQTCVSESNLLCMAYNYEYLIEQVEELNFKANANQLAGIQLRIGRNGERITNIIFNKSASGVTLSRFHDAERGFAFYEPRSSIEKIMQTNWVKEGF